MLFTSSNKSVLYVNEATLLPQQKLVLLICCHDTSG